jgi:hypothetical protein
MTDTHADDPPIDHAARAEALERRIAELEASHTARVIQAELRAEAVRHGMVDLDGLKLVDAKDLALDEDGEVKGLAALMRDFKKAKPWLFGAGSTSSTASAPPAQPPKQKLAKEMTHEEWRAARAELIKRR